MINQLLLATLTVLAGSGAAGCCRLAPASGTLPSAVLGQLNLAMPKEAALELLGPPETAATRLMIFQGDWTPHEILRYRLPGGTNHFLVVFRDALLVEYGPLIGERAGEYEGLFEAYPAPVAEPVDQGLPSQP